MMGFWNKIRVSAMSGILVMISIALLNQTFKGNGLTFKRHLKESVRQDEFELVQHIREHYILKSGGSHGFEDTGKINETVGRLLNAIFDKKKNGVFLEAYASHDESSSITLYLEKQLSWSGVLVEPNNQKAMKLKRRAAHIVPTCLSKHPYTTKPNLSEYEMAPSMKVAMRGDERLFICNSNMSSGEDQLIMEHVECVPAELHPLSACVPLYSILLATDHLSLDFLSLALNGAELAVLQTLPFHKVNVKVILVKSPEGDKELEDYMKTKGYKTVTLLESFNVTEMMKNNLLFVKEDVT